MQGFAVRIAAFFAAALMAAGSLSAQSISISPGYMNIGFGQSIQYTAAVTGLTPATVKWTVNAGGGTITQTGLYTAPLAVPPNGALIMATSTANPKISAVMYANPEPVGPTITAITPSPVPTGNATITLTASPSTPFVKGVLALCAGAQSTPKFISATTLTLPTYNAASTTSMTCSLSNPGTLSGPVFTVPVGGKATPAPVVSPASVTVGLGTSQQFSASNASSWTALYGTITSNGLYTAPVTLPSGSRDTITATGSGGSGTATVALVTPIVVSPSTATAVLATQLQFSATGATSWSATFGKVTSSGLYTAPSSLPSGGKDTVTASGSGGSGTATVTLQNYPAPTVSSITPATLPLGVITATISGSGFNAQSTVTLGGTQLVISSVSANSLAVTGFAPVSGQVNLVVSNGPLGSTPLAVQVGNPNALVSAAAARRFLEQAAFGPTSSDAANVQALGFQGWLDQQFAMGQISNYSALAGTSQGGMAQQFLVNAVSNPDQLRQRVAFALSQIFVTSVNTIIWNGSMAPYEDMLSADAFTNYRQVLGDVTVSPTMGQYLNTANNAKADPTAGTVANENYAREVMQLFTIGTTMLNPDGTPQFDGSGNLVPTYTQAVIGETARVFTGWTYQPTHGPLQWNDFINPVWPMQAYPAEHDAGAKLLLNGYAAPAGLTPQQDLDAALDNIFNHPNVGPFVGKLLIQHLVKSNPSPAYVQRVASAFADNGHGVRGDMKAVLTAILLDPEARANDEGGDDQANDGHLQEPILFIAGIVPRLRRNHVHAKLLRLGPHQHEPGPLQRTQRLQLLLAEFHGPGWNAARSGVPDLHAGQRRLSRQHGRANLFGSWNNPVLTLRPGNQHRLDALRRAGGSTRHQPGSGAGPHPDPRHHARGDEVRASPTRSPAIPAATCRGCKPVRGSS